MNFILVQKTKFNNALSQKMFARNTILISKSSNPYVNTAMGKYIISKYRSSDSNKKILFLSSSHHGVFIGQNQNCWAECNIPLMKKDNISLVRRDTGGGACYVDKGNRLFSFIHKSTEPNFFYPVVVNAFKSMGINAQLKGRNDIVVADKKISGSAFHYEPSGGIMKHHGTILHSIDKDNLAKYLNPNKLKLESKGIKSANARITNLVDINPSIQISDIDTALADSFIRHTGNQVVDFIDIPKKWLDEPEFKKILSEFEDPKYIYNRNPRLNKKIVNV